MPDANPHHSQPKGLALWWQAIRPRTLTMSLSPVLVGLALAWIESGVLGWGVALIALISAMAIQAGTNLHNDAADSLNGTDTSERLGPPRATERGWATAEQVLKAAHLAFGIAVLGGGALVWVGGWPILLLGLFSVIAGYGYSAGPWPLSRGPFGELFVVAFFGMAAVWGTSYLVSGQSSVIALVLGLAVGAPAGAVLLVNNCRDRVGDTRAGRRTLAILAGPSLSLGIYLALMILPFAVIGGLVWVDGAFSGILAGLLALPLAGWSFSLLRRAGDGPGFNRCLAATVGFQTLFCLLLSGGLFLFS
ncbi:1,4-dihydroxy-2-naphthoate octaprenyltransferase [Magnetospira sp. QH-2]|uniref:1,4-dihydroxy-2-naphthoate octaprenyltransferase n=1 Tax=Magnetospira sp. (strain QH-2) TaxID=1288970 RepID=UPI0003E81B8E|nr:1,4-dihydroxy-2-naphthoate octaprenyltransferase [Magnetospira sp. QH-2]CCQ73140.1 1,4-Dihydroxy-2-naphtoate prenyltransferase [Magnetospira sp. QH-2]